MRRDTLEILMATSTTIACRTGLTVTGMATAFVIVTTDVQTIHVAIDYASKRLSPSRAAIVGC